METTETKATSMGCPECGNAAKRFGRHRNGLQRFRCLSCKKTFTESHERGFRVEDYLQDPRCQMAIRMLVEGCSVRTVERLTGIRRDSIIDLLLIAGRRCEKLMDSLHNVPATDVQMDECWILFFARRRTRGRKTRTTMRSATAITGLPSTVLPSLCWPSWSGAARLRTPWSFAARSAAPAHRTFVSNSPRMASRHTSPPLTKCSWTAAISPNW